MHVYVNNSLRSINEILSYLILSYLMLYKISRLGTRLSQQTFAPTVIIFVIYVCFYSLNLNHDDESDFISSFTTSLYTKTIAIWKTNIWLRDYKTVITSLYEHCMNIVWTLYEHCMNIVWTFYGHCVNIVWISRYVNCLQNY